MFYVGQELVVVGTALPNRAPTSQRCTRLSKIRDINQKQQYQQLVAATKDLLLEKYIESLVSSKKQKEEERNLFKERFHVSHSFRDRLLNKRMISWKERIEILGDQAGLNSVKKRMWGEDDDINLSILNENKVKTEKDENESDYQDEINEMLETSESASVSSFVLPPVKSGTKQKLKNSIKKKKAAEDVKLPSILLTPASKKSPSIEKQSFLNNSQTGKDIGKKILSSSRSASRNYVESQRTSTSRNGELSLTKTTSNVTNSIRMTKSELSRLQRIRNELLNRNKYLLTEITKERKKFEAIYPASRIESLKTRNINLRAENSTILEEFTELKFKLHEIAQESKTEKLDLQALQNIKISNENRLKNFIESYERAQEEKMKLEKNAHNSLENIDQLKQQLLNLKNEEDEIKLLENEILEKEKETISNQKQIYSKALEIKNTLKESIQENISYKKELKNLEQIRSRTMKKMEIIDVDLNDLCLEVRSLQSNITRLKDNENYQQKYLMEAENELKQIKQCKLNMRSIDTQTSSYLVVVRDIAWVRIAEEEIILSPHCEQNNRPSTNRSRCGENMAIGTKIPRFEFFDCKDQSTSEALNMKLCKSDKQTQVMWITGD